jgi:hypothetical protein
MIMTRPPMGRPCAAALRMIQTACDGFLVFQGVGFRARPHCGFARPLVHFIPDSLRYISEVATRTGP